MPDCIKGVEDNERANDEMTGHQLNIRLALTTSFGQPISPQKEALIKAQLDNPSDRNLKLLRTEKNREKLHSKFIDYLQGWMVDHTTVGEGYGEMYSSKIRLLQGIFSYKLGMETGNLQYATPTQINNLHLLIEKELGKEAPTHLSAWDNTVSSVRRVAIKHDKSGHALNVIERSTSLGETTKRLGVPFTERVDAINAALLNPANIDVENQSEVMKHVFDIGDNRKRLIVKGMIPLNPVKQEMFSKSTLNLRDKIASMSTNPEIKHDLQDEDGNVSTYKLIKLTGSEIDEYNSIYDTKHPSNSKIWVAMPYLVKEDMERFSRGEIRNKVQTGWYEAQGTAVHNRMITGTKKNIQTYSDFQYMDKQISEALFRPTNANRQNLWDTVNDYTALGKDFMTYFAKEDAIVQEQLEEAVPMFDLRLSELYGNDVELIAEKKKQMVDALGMHGMVSVDKEGNMKSHHTDLRKANDYSPDKFLNVTKIFMMHDRKMLLETELERLENSIQKEKNIIKKGPKNIGEHINNKNLMLQKVKQVTEERDHFLKMIKQIFGIEDYDSGTMQVNHAMSRSLWTDKLQRYRGADLYKLYIDDTIRSLETNKLKIDMMNSIINTPEYFHNYLIDQVKQTAGGGDAEAGLGKFDYSDKKMIERLNTIGVDIDPEFYEKILSWQRGVVSGFNLSWYTAFTNNFQRVNYLVDYGTKEWMEAVGARQGWGKYAYGKSKEDINRAITLTGIKDPLLQFTDVIVAGRTDRTLLGSYRSMKDLATMKAGNDDSFDKLFQKAGTKEKIQLEELKRLRKTFAHILTNDWKEQDRGILERAIKSLEWELTDEYIGRIIDWRLNYFPLSAGKEILTMGGTEDTIRSEGAMMGFILADKLGQLDHNSDIPIYEQENAVRMARIMVYHTQFAFDPINSPKMFRGAFGRMFWQFKPYQYFQAEHDWKVVSNAWNTSGGNNAVETGLHMTGRITKELFKMIGDVGYAPYKALMQKDKLTEPDEIARSFIKFSVLRGMASVATTFYSLPFFDLELVRMAKGAVTGRGLRGIESPLLVYPFRIAKLAMMLSGALDDEEDDKRLISNIIMDYFPAIINIIAGVILQNPYAFGVFVPPGPPKWGYKWAAEKIAEEQD